MTYFQDDNGNVIDVDDDIQIFKSAVNLFDFTIRGNFSTTFQVSNDSINRNNFQYFTPLQIPANGFKATVFNLVRNGNIIERGQLVLERDDDEFLHFFFISGNSNWITQIPDISIKDIDYENFAIQHKPSGPIDYAAATEGFCYPFVDWGMNGKKGDSSYSRVILDVSLNYYESLFNEFYPCFFLKSALQEIFTFCELKLGGDILDDKIYQQMIITPDDGQMKRADKFYTDRKVSVSNSADCAFGKINLNVVLQNGNFICWDSSLQRYIANKSCLLNITFDIILNVSIYSKLTVYKNGSPYATFEPQSSYTGSSANTQSASISIQNIGVIDAGFAGLRLFIDVVTGDYLEFYVGYSGTNQGNFAASGTPTYPGGAVITDRWTVTVGGFLGTLGDFTTVNIGDIIQAKFNAADGASKWIIIPASLGGEKVVANSLINIEPRENLNWIIPDSGGGTNYDTIRASDILPDLKMIELIKFVAQYFCIIPTFDESTKTVSFNKLDNLDYSQAKDWSPYLQKLENNFQIQTAKYNFIKFKEVEDKLLNSLGSNNALKYGDCLIQGQSSTKINNTLFEIPFGSALDKITNKNKILQPFIELVELVPDGSPIPITSISNNGGNAQLHFAATGKTFAFALIYSTIDYNGYKQASTVVFPTDTTMDLLNTPFSVSSTGYIQLLRFNFKSNQSRILFFTGEQNISDFSDVSDIIYNSYNPSSIGYAYFSKPTSSYSISSFKQGLNLDYYQGGYIDIPRRLDWYKNLIRILNAPYGKGWFYLPEAVYADFNFDSFIFIKDEDQQRYYYVDSLENYKDSKTLVQANLLLLP